MVLSATMMASLLAMPISAADDKVETISYNYSYDDNSGYNSKDKHTRQMEKLDRGLIAIKTDEGVYLSWRLWDSEDAIYGSADENVSFNVYRGDTKVATIANKTNYTDTTAGTSYCVAPVINGREGAKCEAVSVDSKNYFDIPLAKPADETITYGEGEVFGPHSFTPADCSTGDVDGDGEYEIIVKWVSAEKDVGSPGTPEYSGTIRLAAYKLDGTRLWNEDVNLGKNVYSSAHTLQFLVYDFNLDGKAEVICQTSLGSTDASGKYVSNSADPQTNTAIYSLTDEENEAADFRGGGRVITGEEFLTVFNGETGVAVDTIPLPTSRELKENDLGASYGDDFGNRSNRFLANVAYLDGTNPYAVFQRGYYFGRNGRQRTSICGVAFDGERLSAKYRFDTAKGQPGYTQGNENYVGNGNHNCTVADVDNDGKDEYITGALCMELNDNDELAVKWCTHREHGDALHIGDYDPTHPGFEFFTVHEAGNKELPGYGYTNAFDVFCDYGMSVIDAKTGDIIFHEGGNDDTGRGVMANVGAGGYYQIWSAKNAVKYTNDSITFQNHPTLVSRNMPSMNFRIFWDGDLYDELLDGTNITSYNGTKMDSIFNARDFDCYSINGSKANPAIQADLFGDWREEVVYPTNDGNNLRVFTTTTPTDYKMKTLMHDPVYRSGVSAQQTTYNQPPHVGFYLANEVFSGSVTGIAITKLPTKTVYKTGEELDLSGMVVTASYSDSDPKAITSYDYTGYNPNIAGTQTITVKYRGKEATFTVKTESGFSVDKAGLVTGYSGTTGVTEETLPTSVDGIVVKGFADNALSTSTLTTLYIHEDPITFGKNVFSDTITLACYEGSTTHKYALENNVKFKLIEFSKSYANVTYEESEYSDYTGKIIAQDTTNLTKPISSLIYNVVGRGGMGDGQTGFYKLSENDNSYLQVQHGRWSNAGRHPYITFENPPSPESTKKYSLSMDFNITENNNKGYILLASGITAGESTTVSTLKIGENNIVAATWYNLLLEYDNGVYTQTITSKSDGTQVSKTTFDSNIIVSHIAFPNDDGTYCSMYIDNINFSSQMFSTLTVNATDKLGTPLNGATVTLGDLSATTNSEGNAVFSNVPAGLYTITVKYSDWAEKSESLILKSETETKNVQLDNSLTVNTPTPTPVIIPTPTPTPTPVSVETPQINISNFQGGKQVKITTATADAEIYYTTDGTAPTAESTKFTSTIELTETTTIKAIAVKEGIENSKIATGKITVLSVETPLSSHPTGELQAGTIITLRSGTNGSTIYYTEDGSKPSTSSQKYSDSIMITSSSTIKAIAVKDGYKDSAVYEVTYTVPTQEVDTATISIVQTTSKAGENVSVPIYLFIDDTDSVTNYEFEINYDNSMFTYDSITPSSDIDPTKLLSAESNGKITVKYEGDAISNGELFNLNFTALSSAVDGNYPVTITEASTKVISSSSKELNVEIINAAIILDGSNNSNLPDIKTDVALTDKDGNDIKDASDIKDNVSANVTVNDASGQTNASILLAIYNRDGIIINTSIMNADFSLNQVFSKTVDIPENESVGSIKIFVWDNLTTMSPLSAPTALLQ